ncbi:hypothetical protein EB796_000729 [Bugula neritina]|uniref:Uncharacterized protein n=1 Tax=Bugula neritina TaxID=10212 RepID=A0A7J7KS60_BUGNE|nr:hypothetical protein EB796_000729 [Bugula neritina]
MVTNCTTVGADNPRIFQKSVYRFRWVTIQISRNLKYSKQWLNCVKNVVGTVYNSGGCIWLQDCPLQELCHARIFIQHFTT